MTLRDEVTEHILSHQTKIKKQACSNVRQIIRHRYQTSASYNPSLSVSRAHYSHTIACTPRPLKPFVNPRSVRFPGRRLASSLSLTKPSRARIFRSPFSLLESAANRSYHTYPPFFFSSRATKKRTLGHSDANELPMRCA